MEKGKAVFAQVPYQLAQLHDQTYFPLLKVCVHLHTTLLLLCLRAFIDVFLLNCLRPSSFQHFTPRPSAALRGTSEDPFLC